MAYGQDIHHKIKPEEVELVRRDYTANEGWETFLSYEDTKQVDGMVIHSFAKMRISSSCYLGSTCLIISFISFFMFKYTILMFFT